MIKNKENPKPLTGAHLKPSANHGISCACCQPLADDEFDGEDVDD